MPGDTIDSDEAYIVNARCPACRVRTEVPVRLVTLLKQTLDKTIIHITLLQETTLHQCGQLRVDDPETGEIIGGGSLP